MEINFSDPEQIRQLIEVLQNMLPKNDTEEKNFDNSKIKTKSVKSNKSNINKNKFLDMPEKDMHKADVKIDKKLSISPPTPRTRKFSTIEVSCRSCGKKEQISPRLIPDSKDRYKCNKCSSSGA